MERFIEKGIQVPERVYRGGRRNLGWTKILKLMVHGDSILVTKKEYHSIYPIARRHKMLIVMRVQPDGNVRFWKLE